MIKDMTPLRWLLLFVLGASVGSVFWLVGNSIEVAIVMALSYQAVVLLLAFIIKNKD
jgi:hypothetical protein